jgi:hypothetical protein
MTTTIRIYTGVPCAMMPLRKSCLSRAIFSCMLHSSSGDRGARGGGGVAVVSKILRGPTRCSAGPARVSSHQVDLTRCSLDISDMTPTDRAISRQFYDHSTTPRLTPTKSLNGQRRRRPQRRRRRRWWWRGRLYLQPEGGGGRGRGGRRRRGGFKSRRLSWVRARNHWDDFDNRS